MSAIDWDKVIRCGPPGVYRVAQMVCMECTEANGGTWEDSSTHVMREGVEQWLGAYLGTKQYYECLHTADDGFYGKVSVEEYTLLHASALTVSDLYEAYVEADIEGNSQHLSKAEEMAAVDRWAALKAQVSARHRAATEVHSLRWILNHTG